jgi:hypothetical protein
MENKQNKHNRVVIIDPWFNEESIKKLENEIISYVNDFYKEIEGFKKIASKEYYKSEELYNSLNPRVLKNDLIKIGNSVLYFAGLLKNNESNFRVVISKNIGKNEKKVNIIGESYSFSEPGTAAYGTYSDENSFVVILNTNKENKLESTIYNVNRKKREIINCTLKPKKK